MAQGGSRAISPICAYVAERTGTSLSAQQVRRLEELLAAKLHSRSVEDYLLFLKSAQGATDLAELMAVISVHKTGLFRDDVQLRAFQKNLLLPLSRSGRPLHFWSAGCATGEEVATLLILLAECGADPASTVLGTDISEVALKQARTLRFHTDSLREVPPALQRRYFRVHGGWAHLDPLLVRQASFERHNLMDRPYPKAPHGQKFDVVFCRNVLIYFTDEAFDRVVADLSEQLVPDGTLVLSSAEPLLRIQPSLATLHFEDAFFYRRRRPNEQRIDSSSELRALSAAESLCASHDHRAESAPVPGRSLQGSIAGPFESQQGGRGDAAFGSHHRPTAHSTSLPVPPAPPLPLEPRELTALEEADQDFHTLMESAAAGAPEEQTEQALRHCLYLDPHFAQARYLLAVLLEQRGSKADAASEYRRSCSALVQGKSRPHPFFLNDARLKVACEQALKRLGYGF